MVGYIPPISHQTEKKSNLHEFLESPMTPICPCKIAVYNNHPPIFGPHCFQPWLMPDTCLGLALFMCFIVKLWKPSWPIPPSLFKNRGLVVVLYRQMADECFESMVFPAITQRRPALGGRLTSYSRSQLLSIFSYPVSFFKSLRRKYYVCSFYSFDSNLR